MTWTRKLLRIDLSSGNIQKEDIPVNILENYIGGKGIATYYLNKEQDPRIDALDADNMIIIATGPAQGVLPIAGRYVIVTKSPLSGIFIDSHVGGYIGPELKFAGYDLIIIKGKAKVASYIEINNDIVSIKSAEHLWGKLSLDTEDALKKEVDAKSKIITIGPAGEKLVRFACVTSDYYRTAGRGGIGMVFGSKNLKAITIRGTNKFDKNEAVKNMIKDINDRAQASKDAGHLLSKLGTSWLVEISDARSQMPTLNYSAGEWENVDKIKGQTIMEKNKLIRKPCYRCSLACAYVLDTDYEWADGRRIQHPEYESLAMLGSNLGIDDHETLLLANHLCNLYGIDTISTGSTISWFIEAGKNGMVPEEYHDETLDFGEFDKILDLIRKIANKEGVGKVLAEGTRIASNIFNYDTDKYAVNVRGLELPAWDPRGKLGLGLSYITSNVGGSHLRGWPKTTEFPRISAIKIIDSLIEEQDLKLIKDSLIMCHFTHSIKPALNIEDTAKIMSVLSGKEFTAGDMRLKAQKMWILARDFNARIDERTIREDDKLPDRLMKQPMPSGLAKGLTAFKSEDDLKLSLDIYYEKRNCNSDGIPTEEEVIKAKH